MFLNYFSYRSPSLFPWRRFINRELVLFRRVPFFFIFSATQPFTIFRFIGGRGTLFFSVELRIRFLFSNLFTTSVRSVINQSPYSSETMLLKKKILRPDIWFSFFFNFFKFFPARSFFIVFLGRCSLIYPFISTMFLMARLRGVFFRPKLFFGLPRLKTRRRVKKKIRKKFFMRRGA